ncbi:twin-arginine translocation pathway signal [Mycolicibacterium sp. 018/SC-01/001]|uniref:twin-arginine translocation pathway signal n=1 Tax=Mycolicibacterium sp. 018/SC-01/001 TaxID=2592069 RepID=UPI00117C0FD8|nr:twin-arginine translocation pathway signal [Mycolicibacterium sp. 018/SC-01/001]TRW80241.1 twin-arginine translocation pathway signal [Mycolicibacterium sp. 018/SC-01/001]
MSEENRGVREEQADGALLDDGVVVDDDAVGDAPGAAARDDDQPPPRRGFFRRHWSAALLIALPVVATAVAVTLYFTEYRSVAETNQSVVADVLKAAGDGTTALLTYSPASVEADTAHAKSLLTGQFLDYYSQFTANVIIPAAKKKEVETGAQVTRSGLVEIHPDKAVVLVFVNQTSSSAQRPEPANSASAVRVTVERQQGRWLISAFDPV